MDYRIECTVSTWLPLVTFCPYNGLPELVYIYVTFPKFKELFQIRKMLRAKFFWQKIYMEEIAIACLDMFPDAIRAKVVLMSGRHRAIAYRKNKDG